MSSKQPKPVLTGQRLRAPRKRDVKEKYDPNSFRDELVAGLMRAGLDNAAKYLDIAGGSLNYRRYAESLFDVLLAGGLLAPGGSLVADGAVLNPVCVFNTDVTDDAQRGHAELVRGLIRRYKYLGVSLEAEICKIVKFIMGFTPENRDKLAGACAFYLAMGLITAKPLASLLTEAVVKNGIALTFVTKLFQIWLREAGLARVGGVLKKSGLSGRLGEFFPGGSCTPEKFEMHCTEAGGLADLALFHSQQETTEVKRMLAEQVAEMLEQEANQDVVIECVRAAEGLSEPEVVSIVWTCVMDSVEWNKKAELILEQAIRHVKANMALLGAVVRTHEGQVRLMVSMQNYCYENQNFLKIFNRLILLLYKAEVLGEDAVLVWYERAHSAKGKMVFLEQMKQMVDWLRCAEEESSGEEEEEEEDDGEGAAAAT